MSSSQIGRNLARNPADRRPVQLAPNGRRARPDSLSPQVGLLADHLAPTAPVTVSVESVIEGEDAELLWQMYRTSFEPLAELAALQHLFTRQEMLEEFANPRIQKIVGWAGADPVALGLVTNHLDSVPQMSPAFLRARYPEHATRDAIYYGILVAVTSDHRGLTMFNRLYTTLWQIVAEADGVLAFDVCKFNRDAFDSDAVVDRIASMFPQSRWSIADQQTWYVAELPKPIGAD